MSLPPGPDAFAAGLAAAWPRELIDLGLLAFDELDSTQRVARMVVDRYHAEDETPLPFAVVATSQTAGRGRRGRSWESACGRGLWASLAVAVDEATLPTLPMRAATSLVEVAAEIADGVRLKWPNDLVWRGRKLGGLLVDAIVREGAPAWAVVGFGVNLSHAETELPSANAISLRLAAVDGQVPELADFAIRCLHSLWRGLAAVDADWLERYRACSVHEVGDPIAVELENECVEGEFAGFDSRGFLCLRHGTATRVITSGDLFAW